MEKSSETKQISILKQEIKDGFWIWPDGLKTSMELIRDAIRTGANKMPKDFFKVCNASTEDWVKELLAEAKENHREEHEKYPDRFYDSKGKLTTDGKPFPQETYVPKSITRSMIPEHTVTVTEVGGATVLNSTSQNVQNLVLDSKITLENIKKAIIKRLRLDESDPRANFTVKIRNETGSDIEGIDEE